MGQEAPGIAWKEIFKSCPDMVLGYLLVVALLKEGSWTR